MYPGAPAPVSSLLTGGWEEFLGADLLWQVTSVQQAQPSISEPPEEDACDPISQMTKYSPQEI